jgi:hypothetical protein
MKYVLGVLGAALFIVSIPVLAGPAAKLAPGVAAVYAEARAGTLKTTNAKDEPRRESLGPRFDQARPGRGRCSLSGNGPD